MHESSNEHPIKPTHPLNLSIHLPKCHSCLLIGQETGSLGMKANVHTGGSLVGETLYFLEESVFPQLAQSWREAQIEEGNGEQILPTKLPLKRRLAEFRHSGRRPLSGDFSGNLWAIERFRDITPVMVVAVFDGWLVLEPGDIGPLPLGHPVAREIVEAVNGQRLTRGMLGKLVEMGAPLYDGCAVIGIVDYRKWSFGMAASTLGGSAGASALGSKPNWTPEMHKILLKPSYEVLLDNFITNNQSETNSSDETDLLAVEANMVKATSGPVCLDPSPLIFQVMSLLNYNAKKFQAALRPEPFSISVFQPSAGDDLDGGQRTCSLGSDSVKSTRIDAILAKMKISGGAAVGLGYSSEMPQGTLIQHQQQGPRRFRLLNAIEERRNAQTQLAARPIYGLDARKDPSRLNLNAPPPLSWLPPNTALWRTLRFEGRPSDANEDDSGRTVEEVGKVETAHYTVHILISSSGYGAKTTFEVLIRVGSSPCASDLCVPLANSFTSKNVLDVYVEQLKQIMQIEGKTCVADVSNPNAIASLLRGPNPAPPMMMNDSGSSSSTPSAPSMLNAPMGYGLQTQPNGMLMMRKGTLYGGVASGVAPGGSSSPILGPTGRMGPPSMTSARNGEGNPTSSYGAPVMRQLRPPRKD